MQSNIIIIGGGASGLTAAISAANLGAKVTIIEHNHRIGQKILVTGNGKCNLTNSNMDTENFRGEHPEFAAEVLNKFGLDHTISFFESLGLLVKEKNGCIYPLSGQASTVLDVLRFRCEGLKIEIYCNTTVKSIKKNNGHFIIETKELNGELKKLTATHLILATGGKASPKTGSDGSGYRLAKEFGHSLVEPVPALAGLRCREPFFKSISGVRTQAGVCIEVENKKVISQTGELQLTNYGLSGIPVFQISRFAAAALRQKSRVRAIIDFLPDYSNKEIEDFLNKQLQLNPEKTIEQHLYGFLHKKIAALVIKQVSLSPLFKANQAEAGDILGIVDKIKHFYVEVMETNSFEEAQVCAGGVDTREVHAPTLESRLVKNLFITGELLDIDGTCGGYNLQWAWSTGFLAGRAAAEVKYD